MYTEELPDVVKPSAVIVAEAQLVPVVGHEKHYLQIPNHQAFMHGTKRHARSVVDGATSGASRGQGKLRCQPLLRRRLS